MPLQSLEPDAPQRRTTVARWGLWAMTVSMAVALVLGALFAWQSSRQAAESLVQTRANDLFQLLRRELRRGGADLQDSLEGIPEEFHDLGLRYLAVFSPQAEVRYAWGQPHHLLPPDMHATGRGERKAQQLATRTRLEGPLSGRGPNRHTNWLVIEVESSLALSLTQNARLQLLLSIVVAFGLLALAWLFWRMARRADASEAALARDRHLAALGEMSATLGHELRNPLASLKGHAQLALERTPGTERTHKNLLRVVNEAQRMERLMGHILSFARDRALELGMHSLVALVAELQQRLGGELQVEMAPELADAEALFDRDALLQVLENLCQNAREAAPSTPVELRCFKDSEGLHLEVLDRGPGFPRDEQGRFLPVFEPFKSINKVYGTGLGLAIAKRIIEAHQGQITVSDRPGGGACVSCILPQPLDRKHHGTRADRR